MKLPSGLFGLLLLLLVVAAIANAMDAERMGEVHASDDEVPFRAWRRKLGGKMKNTADKHSKVYVDHESMSRKLREVGNENDATTTTTKIVIDLTTAEDDQNEGEAPVECELRKYPVMAPELSEKYPNIIATSGICQDGSNVVFTIDTDTEKSFHGYVFRGSDGAHFVIDPHDDDDDDEEEDDHTGTFLLSRAKDRTIRKEAMMWKDNIVAESNKSNRTNRKKEETGRNGTNDNRRKLEVSGSTIHTFRIAIMTRYKKTYFLFLLLTFSKTI